MTSIASVITVIVTATIVVMTTVMIIVTTKRDYPAQLSLGVGR
jgi:hypothetical protein